MTFSKTMLKSLQVQSSFATNAVLISDPPFSHKSMLTEKRTATQSRRQWGWVLKTSTAWWRRGLAAWWCEGHTWPRWGIQSLWLPPPAMPAVQTSCKTSCGRLKIVLVCLPQPLLMLILWHPPYPSPAHVINLYHKQQLTGHPWSRRFPSWRRLQHSRKRRDGEAPGSVLEASTAQTSGRRYWALPEGTAKKGNKCHLCLGVLLNTYRWVGSFLL